MISIFEAIQRREPSEVIRILQEDPDQIESLDSFGNRPLHEATRNLQNSIVRLLLEHGADVDATGEMNNTAFHFAILEEATEIVRQLLAYGADTEIRNQDGFTPLQMACRIAPEIAEILVQCGATVDLNCAIWMHDLVRVQKELNSTELLNSVSSFPDRLLEDAMHAGNQEIFNLLIQCEKHPTPLELSKPESLFYRGIEHAMATCDLTYIRVLLIHGAATNVRNERGETPFQYLEKFSPGILQQMEAKQELAQLLFDSN